MGKQKTLDLTSGGAVAEVPFGKLREHEDNIRDIYEGIEDLAASIAASGLHTPLKVRAEEDGGYTILAGHRRYRALQHLEAGPDTPIPALVTSENGQSDQVTMLVENIFRDDVDELEEAKSIRTLVEGHGLTQKAVAQATGLDPSVVSNRMKLSKLPALFHASVRDPQGLTLKQGMTLASQFSLIPDAQVEALEIDSGFRAVVSTDDDGNPVTSDEVDLSVVLDYTMCRAWLNAGETAAREQVITKAIGQVEKAGHPYFRSESEVEVPEGKALKFTQRFDAIEDVTPKRHKGIVISVAHDGTARFRPVIFRDLEETEKAKAEGGTVSNPDAERQKRNREWKRKQAEAWTEALSGKVSAADVKTSVLDLYLGDELGQKATRAACELLGLTKAEIPTTDHHYGEKDKDGNVKQVPDWDKAFADLKAPEAKKQLALVAGEILSNSSGQYFGDARKEFAAFWT